ncbi:MAG: hypothetical protein D6758_14005 [Gammaproteobacteria bacterium]|nr:MAG: hypothetical protein D6758_14005 [Gammaproteobacteria bacterium]
MFLTGGRRRLGWVAVMYACTITVSQAAIRNNNHVFALSTQCEAGLEAVAGALGKPLPNPDTPVFQNRLPIHLYAKTLDFHDQVRQLQQANGVPPLPAEGLPEGTVRPRNVYRLLEAACEGLYAIGKARGLQPPPEPESALGKTTDDNYARLWRLTQRMAALVPPPQASDVARELARAEKALDNLASSQSLTTTEDITAPGTPSTSPRAMLLVGYQVLHLTGRLQRQLNVEAIRPGSVKTGQVTLQDLYDLARILNADLHRTLQALRQPGITAAPAPESADIETLARRWAQLRDRLLALTGSEPV